VLKKLKWYLLLATYFHFQIYFKQQVTSRKVMVLVLHTMYT